MKLVRGFEVWGRSAASRACIEPSTGSTLYFSASVHHSATSSRSWSGCSAATLWDSVGSSPMWYSSQPVASSWSRTAGVIGSPNLRPSCAASAKSGPGQGHTARQPSW